MRDKFRQLILFSGTFIALSFLTPPGYALGISQPRISGFLSAGATHNDNETPYQDYEHKTEFEQDSLLGIQFDGSFGDGLRYSGQLLAYDEDDSYEIEPEWAYIGYSPNIDWEVKAGLYRVPNFIYSETIHVGISYPWLRPPAEVYNLLETTKAHGVIATYTKPLEDSTLYIKSFYGQRRDKTNYQGVDFSISVDRLCGINASWEGNGFKLNLTALNIAGDATIYAGPFPVVSEFDRRQFTFGVQKEFGKTFVIAETTRLNNGLDSNYKEEGAYITLGHYFPVYTPYVTFGTRNSKARGDTPDANLRDSESFAIGTSRQLTANASVSAEWLTARAKNDTAGLFGARKNLAIFPGDDDKVNLLSFRIDVVF